MREMRGLQIDMTARVSLLQWGAVIQCDSNDWCALFPSLSFSEDALTSRPAPGTTQSGGCSSRRPSGS